MDTGPFEEASSRHAYVVARTLDHKTVFVVDALVLRRSMTLCAQLREAGHTVHESTVNCSPRPPKPAIVPSWQP